jgi:hypothetical protein
MLVATFTGVGLLHFPMISVLAVVAPVSVFLAYRSVRAERG